MESIKISFVIGQLADEEVDALKTGQAVITKMILSREDFTLFHYHEDDRIEVETGSGNRRWCTIKNLEVVPQKEQLLIIFTLLSE